MKLVLQIRALRDALDHPQSEIQPKSVESHYLIADHAGRTQRFLVILAVSFLANAAICDLTGQARGAMKPNAVGGVGLADARGN
jgi:hypothetical protein